MERGVQTYRNHRRVDPLHHLILIPITGVTLILASDALVQAGRSGTGIRTSVIIFLLALSAALTAFIARRNGLVVQNRGIHTNENLRHFMLTGKPLDSRITLSQVIALRFASDAEFMDLAARAAATGMRPDEIKRAIKQWRPDLHRV